MQVIATVVININIDLCGSIIRTAAFSSVRQSDWGLISHVGIEKRSEHEYLICSGAQPQQRKSSGSERKIDHRQTKRVKRNVLIELEARL